MTRARKRAEPGTAPSCWGRVRCVDCTGSREARALGKSDASPMLMVMPTVRRCRSIQLFARLEKVSIRIDRIQRFKDAWRLVPPPGPACSAVYKKQLYASRARGSQLVKLRI